MNTVETLGKIVPISDRDFVGDCRKLAEFDFPFVAQRNYSNLGSASRV